MFRDLLDGRRELDAPRTGACRHFGQRRSLWGQDALVYAMTTIATKVAKVWLRSA